MCEDDSSEEDIRRNGNVKADTFPTDARIAQKERLKAMKERGEKPKKKKIPVEDGNDDCGDSLDGLGKDIILYGADWINDWAETALDLLRSHTTDTPIETYLTEDTKEATVTLTVSLPSTLDEARQKARSILPGPQIIVGIPALVN